LVQLLVRIISFPVKKWDTS